MTLTGHIISTSGKRLSRIEVEASGMSRATIRQAELLAREWAAEHGMRVVSDIVSQGECRAWVEPAHDQPPS